MSNAEKLIERLQQALLAQAESIDQQAREIEALRADAERLDWCIERMFNDTYGWLTTDVGCGCCGEGKTYEGLDGRAAIDAAIDAALAGKEGTP
jgi:hypothetical protein